MLRTDLCPGHEVTSEIGSIHVSDAVMPPREQGLWEHLRLKYGSEIDITTLCSRNRR